MTKPSIFVGSSTEGLPVARAIKAELEHDAVCVIWNQSYFGLNLSTLEGLLGGAQRFDFGIFVFSPDDDITIRGEQTKITRDNVIFEFGLFLGALGRDRVFVVRSGDDLRILSDLAGITVAHYEPVSDASEMRAAVGTACEHIRRAIGNASADRMESTIYKLSPTLLYVLRHMEAVGDARPALHFRNAIHNFLRLMGERCAKAPLKPSDGWDKAADYALRYLESVGMVKKVNTSEYEITQLGKTVLAEKPVAGRYNRAFQADLVSIP